MSKRIYIKSQSVLHLDSFAKFSKKYRGKRVGEILRIDPDYLLFIMKKTEVKFSPEVVQILDATAKDKEVRGITKTTCFK